MGSDKLRKFIVILALVLFGAVFLLLAATAWGIFSLSGFVNYLEDGPIVLRILLGILFVALFAGIIAVIVAAAKIGRQPSRSEMNLLAQTNGGASYISSDAVAAIAQRVLKKNKQIKNAACSVIPVEDGVNLDVKLSVFSGGDLSGLCSSVQNGVKNEIESATGIPVRNVAVNIVKTVEGAEPAVEKRVN